MVLAPPCPFSIFSLLDFGNTLQKKGTFYSTKIFITFFLKREYVKWRKNERKSEKDKGKKKGVEKKCKILMRFEREKKGLFLYVDVDTLWFLAKKLLLIYHVLL